ncbi:hypothetical protein J2R99_002762 [Rhodopseudomonas julia]|uniref:Uncharacterized protein n=1 Tax=Rhodopseudomonas julia TaxID=200617 RepID=A0ABU0C8N4_9BRAD|nr:hypothetical protein [Rhodopseudomonas julia]MDQ0326893.1 hypothetical protein [Rhodopseudomonas julia]
MARLWPLLPSSGHVPDDGDEMLDVFFVGLALGFFAVAALSLRIIERL